MTAPEPEPGPAELTREIADVARRHLASEGAAALSLRAVARELGMASSAVYRYFPSRDDLLTALIVDAYDALGAAAEEAEAAAPRADLRARLAGGVRRRPRAGRWPIRTSTRWSTARRCPVTRRRRRPSGAGRRGSGCCSAGSWPTGSRPASSTRPATDRGRTRPCPGRSPRGWGCRPVPHLAAARAVQAWTSLFGLISFELFGHTHNVVADHEALFDGAVERLATCSASPRA